MNKNLNFEWKDNKLPPELLKRNNRIMLIFLIFSNIFIFLFIICYKLSYWLFCILILFDLMIIYIQIHRIIIIPTKISITHDGIYYVRKNGKKGFIGIEKFCGLQEYKEGRNEKWKFFELFHSQKTTKGSFENFDKYPPKLLSLSYENGKELFSSVDKWIKAKEERIIREVKEKKGKNINDILFYRSWSEIKRKRFRFILFIFMIIFTIPQIYGIAIIIDLCMEYDYYLIIFMIFIFILYNVGFLLQVNFILSPMNREFCIYTDGIKVQKGLVMRKFIPYSKFSEIRLNTKENEYVGYIEYKLSNNKKLLFNKCELNDWKEFYRVMLYEINNKVKIIE